MHPHRLPAHLRTFVVALALLGGLLASGASAVEPGPVLVDGAPPAAGVVGALESLAALPEEGVAEAPRAEAALHGGGAATCRLLNLLATEINYCYECATYA